MKPFWLLGLALALLVSGATAQAATFYVCGSSDYENTYVVADKSKSTARREALRYCRANSSTPNACDDILNCKAFAGALAERRHEIVPFPESLRPRPNAEPPRRRDEPREEREEPIYRQCENDSHCPGFANHCFAGKCKKAGFQCENDSQCPGFANYCFAGKCKRQEALCENDSHCPGFANYCFAGRCKKP